MTIEQFIKWLEENPDASLPELNQEFPDGLDFSDATDSQIRSIAELSLEGQRGVVAQWARKNAGSARDAFRETIGTVRSEIDAREEAQELADLDGDGDVTEEEIQQARQSSDPEVRAAAEATGEVRFTLDKKYLDAFGVGQGGRTEQDAIDAIIEKVYEQHGVQVETVAEAERLGYLTDPLIDAAAQQFVVAAEQTEPEFEPTLSIKVRSQTNQSTGPLDGQGYFTMSQPEYEVATKQFGMTGNQLASTITLADMYGSRRADGTGVAWQPLAALLRASGQTATGTSADVRDQKLSEVMAFKKELDRAKDSARSGGPGGDLRRIEELQRRFDEASAEWQSMKPGQKGNSDPSMVPSQLMARYNRNLDLYGRDHALAFIATMNAGLAARMSKSGGDPANLDALDAELVGQYVSQAFPGASTTDDLISGLVGLGWGEAAGSATIASWMKLFSAKNATGGGGAERTRIQPDRVQVEQAAKDFYQQLYMSEPDDATLASFTNQVMAQVAGTPLDQDVNVEARIRDIAEGLPEYKELYGKKGGLDEAEYQGMMRSGQASMLGNEIAGNQATKLGMRQGQYQTAVGAAAGTSEAWDNSTFLGRLARASQVVSANT